MAAQFSRSRLIIPAAAGVGTVTIAFLLAILSGSGMNSVTAAIESQSSSIGGVLTDVGDIFSLGFAFTAGMAAAVNPCGFAMLPAYLALYLNDSADESRSHKKLRTAFRPVLVGCVVTIGFVIIFAMAGVPISIGTRTGFSYFPWIGLITGVLLCVAGVWVFAGGSMYSRLPSQISSRMPGFGQIGVRGYFSFGLAYGMASLSCTLPIFLAVIGSSSITSAPTVAISQFILYALGMGSVIMAITLSVALWRQSLLRTVRSTIPYTKIFSVFMLEIAGGFIVYYWLTLGGVLETIVRTIT